MDALQTTVSTVTGVMNLRTAGVALTFALVAGAIIFVAARLARFTGTVVTYHAAVYMLFFGLYTMIPGGFAKHFAVPTDKPVGAADVAYYTMVTHSGVGYGDIYPKTTQARVLVTAHLFMAVMAIFNMVPLGSATLSYGGAIDY